MASTSNLAFGLDSVPVVVTTAQRAVKFPSPGINQRVHNLETGDIERWTGSAWETDFTGTPSGGGAPVQFGNGAPNGSVTGPLGGVYQQRDGTNGQTLWWKTRAPTGNTGWSLGQESLAVFNVQRFGTAGNGVTDDTTAFQAAVTAAGVAGGVVEVPPGTYLLSAPIALSAANVVLRGHGSASKLTVVAGYNTESSFSGKGLLDLTATRCGVRDLAMDFTGATNATGVRIAATDECRIENVTVLNPPSTTVLSGYGIEILGLCRRNVVTNCLVSGAGYSSFDCAQDATGVPVGNVFAHNRSMNFGVNSFDIFRTIDTLILGNVCTAGSGTDAAIRLTGGTTGQPNQGVVVAHNVIDSCPTVGIVFINVCVNCVAEGNSITNAGNGGAGGKGIVFSGTDVSDCVAANNSVVGASDDGIEVSGYRCRVTGNTINNISGEFGILVDGGQWNSVSDNTVFLTGKHGLNVTAGSDHQLTDNYVKDASQAAATSYDGISIAANTCLLTGNVVRYDNTLTNQQRRGLTIVSGTGNLVMGNDLRTSGASAIYSDSGTATIARYNEGAFELPVRTITTTTTLTAGDELVNVDTSAGNVVVNLPAVATCKGQVVIVKKITSDASTVTLTPNGAELIDGRGTQTCLYQYQGFAIRSDGGTWRLVGAFGPSFATQPVSADNGDAAASVTWALSAPIQMYNTVLTANRAVTLQTTGAFNGSYFYVVRTAAATGAFSVQVGTGPLASLGIGEWCLVTYDGAAWGLKARGLLAQAAPLASPVFTGTPAAPTAAPGTNTTQLATTAFVATSFAPLASPALTGTPTAPTATANTNSTQLATTAYVDRTPGGSTITSAAPTGTASATAVMMGVNSGASIITPTKTGRVLFMASGMIANSTAADGATVDLRTSTGTGPANAAAVTGTLRGIAQTMTSVSAAQKVGFTLHADVPGLTIGQAYWADLSLLAVTGGTASVTGVTITAVEI